MKKSYTFPATVLLALCITAQAFSQTETAPSGSGTQADPYLIDSLDNLYWLQYWQHRYSDVGGSYNKYYKQTADINASSTSGWNSGAGFSPIGNTNIQFTGTYDGNGHTIDSLYISKNGFDEVGMFGYLLNGGTVKKLHLTNVNVTGSTQVGGLVGRSEVGTIDSCSVTGSISIGTSAQELGGLVGHAVNSTIDSCYSTASFNSTSGSLVGGFVGHSDGTTIITNSYSSGNINGSSGGGYLGGFAGENEGTITNCYSTGNVIDNSSSSNYVGGFVGANYNGGSISTSYCSGNVQGYGYIGGFVGEDLTSCVIKNSYSRSNVVSNSGLIVGGFAGYIEATNGSVDTCFSTGNVSGGSSNVGGLIGVNGGNVNNSFWDTTTSGQSTSDGGTGKSTTQMKTQSTFTNAGWNTTIWYMDGAVNDGYPYLSWQNSGGTPLPIQMTSFSAALLNNDNTELKWATATEVQNAGWEVERKTIIGDQLTVTSPSNRQSLVSNRQWAKIGFVSGSGTSNSPKNYFFTDQHLFAGQYAYRLKQINTDGTFKYSQEVEVVIKAPHMFALEQNYPNPFNPTTMISYQLPANGYVTLKVYDMLGREVTTLVNEVKSPGTYEVNFDGSKLSNGVYFYTLNAGNYTATKKLLLMK